MKKTIIVIIILLVFASLAYAEEIYLEETDIISEKLIPNDNEVSAYYSSKRIEKNQGSQRFWHLKSIRLDWIGDDYCVDLDITPLANNKPMVIKQSWLKLHPFENFDFIVGKSCYPFCDVSSKSSKNITIFQPQRFGAAWMLDFCFNFDDMKIQAYWADEGTNSGIDGSDSPSTIGGKISYSWEGLNLGAALKAIDWDTDADDSDRAYDYGFDIIYCWNDMAKFNLQIFNLDDNNEDTSDLNYFFIASYQKGFCLPIANKTIPYAGIFSKRELVNGNLGDAGKEYNIVLGMNAKPLENAFFKCEYNIESNIDENSLELTNEDNYNVSNALSVEVGYKF